MNKTQLIDVIAEKAELSKTLKLLWSPLWLQLLSL
ncbi:DNA-binding protein HU-alpha [Escherichia coli]|nr:DNA-binding protein HU-alpha [Escherichia coli]